jgi:two-component system, NtrC family, sensor histidine kinase GlrK
MRKARRLRLAARLAMDNAVLGGLLLVLFGVMFVGLLRMQSTLTEIRDSRLSTIDAEEELHRAAWRIEVTLRHAENACDAGVATDRQQRDIVDARASLASVYARTASRAPQRLVDAVDRYRALADRAVAEPGCAFVAAHETATQRLAVDEELTNAWIERLHELHVDIDRREDGARLAGTRIALFGGLVAVLALVTAILVARATARSVAAPISTLAKSAMRLGEGDFSPLPTVSGPAEVEELREDLERLRERLIEAERLKQSFLANVSHELRSPLGRLREALTLVADGTCGPLTDRQTRVLTLASRACEREVRLVDALLDMSRLRAGLPVRLEHGCDPDRVLATAIADEQVEAVERGVDIASDTHGNAPVLDMDSALVERAIANLLRNAISVSPRGARVDVKRRVTVDESGERRITIDVVDRGPGMPPAIREDAFRPFHAAAVEGPNRPAGIGLGLAFAREVATAHDGNVTVVETSDRGTTVRIELPVRTAASRSAA